MPVRVRPAVQLQSRKVFINYTLRLFFVAKHILPESASEWPRLIDPVISSISRRHQDQLFFKCAPILNNWFPMAADAIKLEGAKTGLLGFLDCFFLSLPKYFRKFFEVPYNGEILLGIPRWKRILHYFWQLSSFLHLPFSQVAILPIQPLNIHLQLRPHLIMEGIFHHRVVYLRVAKRYP